MVGRKEGKYLFDRGLSVQNEEEDWRCRWLVVDCRLEGVMNEHVDLFGTDSYACHAADPAKEEHGKNQ